MPSYWIVILGGLFMVTTSCSYPVDSAGEPLPGYVTINWQTHEAPSVLKTPANKLSFPLTPEDIKDIRILEAKFDQEGNCSGLAAPQIGIAKRMIVFAAPENPDLRKWRPDFTQTMGKTIWINPSYKGTGADKNKDYEACFSVPEKAGPVIRYKTIRYDAYTLTGEHVEGTAEGFLARIIQHEIDHINGKLFIDYVPRGQLLSIEEYRKKRAEAMETGNQE